MLLCRFLVKANNIARRITDEDSREGVGVRTAAVNLPSPGAIGEMLSVGRPHRATVELRISGEPAQNLAFRRHEIDLWVTVAAAREGDESGRSGRARSRGLCRSRTREKCSEREENNDGNKRFHRDPQSVELSQAGERVIWRRPVPSARST